MSPDDTALILHRLDEHGEKLDRIERQATLTNGRVSKLELWQARLDGARWAFSWLPTVLTGVITAVVVYALTHG